MISQLTKACMDININGEVLFMWGKEHYLSSPSQAEAWLSSGLCTAIQERWSLVIFKGDAKLWFDPLTHPDIIPSWPLSTTISNIRSLTASFEFL